MTHDEYKALRNLTVAHQHSEGCGWCDSRWEKIEAEVERLVGAKVLASLARTKILSRMRNSG